MTLVVIGASAPNVIRLAAAASSRGLRVATGAASRPSWVIVATAIQRRDALARFGLPAFRVIEWPGLEGEAAVAADVLARGIARMAELGPYRPVVSRAGVALIRRMMPWVMRTLNRAIGPDDPVEDVSAAKAAARDARMLEKAARLEDAKEARARADRKARRAVEREAKMAARRHTTQPRDGERPR
jgi:hypothetical protein